MPMHNELKNNLNLAPSPEYTYMSIRKEGTFFF